MVLLFPNRENPFCYEIWYHQTYKKEKNVLKAFVFAFHNAKLSLKVFKIARTNQTVWLKLDVCC